MKLDWLADVHHDAGLTVIEHSGWKTRTMRDFDQFHPVALIDHHTAGSAVIPNYPDPPFYRNEALEDRCNITIRPDGVVVVLNAGYAYDSGWGAPEVLSAVRNDRPLPNLAGLRSTTLGNAWFIDNEVQHLGNGSPIEPVQRDALIRSNAAICEHMGWDPRYRLIGHREWAPDRKVDPRWDGNANPMPKIRQDTYELMEEEDMSFTQGLTEAQWRALYRAGGIDAPSEQAAIDYWVHHRDAQGNPIQPPSAAEHAAASASVFTWFALQPTGGGVSESKVKELIASAQLQVP